MLRAIGAVDPPDLTSVAALAKGRVALVGTLRCTEPLISPVQQRACAAYSYRSSSVGSGRSSDAARRRPLRRVSVYARALQLELDDGVVVLEPPASDDFDPAAHQALVELDLPGFQAVENTLRDGTRVRVLGDARPGADGWSVRALQLNALTEEG